MPIQKANVKLVKAQVMDDSAQGGGAPTSIEIVDGVSNSIFPDVSELARAGGNVALRKVFVYIKTPDTDTYMGCNVIVAEGPSDPRVSITLFTTNNIFDARDAARSRIESYLAPGPEWGGFLLENHIQGQRSVQIFQQIGSEVIPVGRTLRLVYRESLSDERSQYVRITRTTTQERTFVGDDGSPFQAMVVTAEISDPLQQDFPGTAPNRFFKRDRSLASMIRDTVVADAATYFGVSKLTQAIALGDVAAKVESIFTQLVPSAQTEIPLVDFSAAGQSVALIASASGTVSYTTGLVFNTTTVLSVGNSIMPGSLVINVGGGNLTDDGGQLYAGAIAIGTVDYARGEVRFSGASPTYYGTKVVTFLPGAAPLQLADTASISVTQETRSYNYSLTIDPPPAPGTLIVSYRSQGKWYDLRDNGSGVLRGTDSTFGSGTISYVTGTASVTCGALPDAGSEVTFAWGAKVNYFNRASVFGLGPRAKLQLSKTDIKPSTVTIAWNDGSMRTATDDGHGILSGGGMNGRINYRTGEIWFQLANTPLGGTTYGITYGWGSPFAENFPAPLRGGDGKVTLTLAETDITPNTVELTWNLLIEEFEEFEQTNFVPNVTLIDPYKTIRDNGAGQMLDAHGVNLGTINYATGVITFTPDVTVQVPKAKYGWKVLGQVTTAEGTTTTRRWAFLGFQYVDRGAFMPFDETGLATVSYWAANLPTTQTDTLTTSGIQMDLTEFYAERIVPGSINFLYAGKNYFDRNGALYYDLDIGTGAATLAGSVNYQTGEANITAWTPNQPAGYAVKSLLTALDGRPVDEVTFRIPVSPVRPGSFQFIATKVTGGLLNVTADTEGNITSAGVSGRIDYSTGTVRIRFGTRVTAAGNETMPWYDADLIGADGKIFRPELVFADTIKYNAVGYTYLPLDSNILGLDPVRLPQDGRVAIYRPGGFVVIGHAAETTATVANGQTINAGRVRLSRWRVIGADGVVINTGYTEDLEAGTITFTDVSGYSQPVTIENRIEDLLQMSDVQISGQLAFTRQVTHAYPIGSYVSSALIGGDLFSRISAFFDQASWTNVWSDTVIGANATASYNRVANPILFTNEGAITERWAIVFTSSTAFNVIGENVGVIATGTTGSDLAPINPEVAGVPYFTLKAAGWGLGWAAGNVLRFNTIGSLFPVWAVRTVQQGPETVTEDQFTLLVRGDVDRP